MTFSGGGVKTYSDPPYIFSGGSGPPQPPMIYAPDCGCYSSHRETAVLGASLQDFNMNRTLNIRIGCITCLDVLRIGELHGNTKLKTTSSPYTPTNFTSPPSSQNILPTPAISADTNVNDHLTLKCIASHF